MGDPVLHIYFYTLYRKGMGDPELLIYSHTLYRKSRGDPVLHIDLRKWTDVCIVAPLDANTLGKVLRRKKLNML